MQGENTNNGPGQNDAQALPGAVISPDSATSPSPNSTDTATPRPAQVSPASQVQQEAPLPAPIVNDQSGPSGPPNQPLQSDGNSISWSAPQFISHDKSNQWFLICLAGAAVLGVIIYLITKDFLSAITIAFAIVILGAYSYRKPKNINYAVSQDGIGVGTRVYVYEEFRSFTAVPEGPYLSVTLFPLKRFAPLVGLYYMGEDESLIVDFLSERLPMQEPKSDLVDNLMRRIKF
jgi:hypothetical protein